MAGARPSDEASQADQRFNQLASELEELASEHAGGVGRSKKRWRRPSVPRIWPLRDGPKRADAIRRAADGLPAGRRAGLRSGQCGARS